MSKFPYEDIIGRERPVSKSHPPASMADRAARFSPFAAINGYEAMVQEAARVTQPRMELDENRKAVLDERIRDSVGQTVTITYFQPDKKKEGGAYLRMRAVLVRLDEQRRCLCLDNGQEILIENVFDVEK